MPATRPQSRIDDHPTYKLPNVVPIPAARDGAAARAPKIHGRPSPEPMAGTNVGATADDHVGDGDANVSALADSRRYLLDNLATVKRARFNAAKRLRAKHEAGQFVLALTFVYGSLVPLFTLQFRDQLGDLQANLLSFVAAVSSMLSFVVAVHYQQQRLERTADDFHACGLALNKLRYELQTDPTPSRDKLLDYLGRYDATLKSCANHDDVDYDRAVLDGTPQAALSSRIKVEAQRIMQTYGVSLVVIAVPPLVGWLVWAFVGK